VAYCWQFGPHTEVIACCGSDLYRRLCPKRCREFFIRHGSEPLPLRGADRFTELGGFEQTCGFDKDLYFNPGSWRIPYHHGGILNYCKRLGVSLEPFSQANYNAYLHARDAFGGKPQRLRHILSDFHGNVAELLAKAVSQDQLDQPVTAEDKELLLEALRQWGALDAISRLRQRVVVG
jgi:monoamine oxidase